MAVNPSRAPNVTELLRAWGHGDQAALEQLTPTIYHELHRIARYHMSRESEDHTLQTTALINEAYLRLVDYQGVHWHQCRTPRGRIG
jgi:RNA polymerase sigma-70 factor (ECF subfamily)